ncbi:glycosyl hydrolase family 26 [Sediminihabitans luteus]|uniref:Glycosyl hydrolase family 26 n=1 Tax=Sediminihabitans luteus TaxID=1138585 RepID=A0A2M9CZG2_9CELL|nr:glycosyl hydrolase [Sediminihabitans luteus]PJJ77128.1 glycosyl hydrolase family 26 [Sediminihabitans luteus]GII98576.1 hypothetical protein Slu03_09540 [Sediminihabitans luteus]
MSWTPPPTRPVAAALVLALSLLTGCAAQGAPDPAPSATGEPEGSRGRLAWGAYVADDGEESSDLDVVTEMTGRPLDYVHLFAATGDDVPLAALDDARARGATPLVTLEPWEPGQGVDQPGYALARVADGDHDADLERWAAALADQDGPVLLRFAHEMNGDWYPWAVGVNGNTADDYLAAWAHLRDVLDAAGASRVQLVWAPNVPLDGASDDVAAAFPGPDAVDVLGLDGYNWGDGDGHAWEDPDELFGPGLAMLDALDGDRPVLVTEVASVEGPGPEDKARWVGDLVDLLATTPGVVGLVWFQTVKERDWRLNSTQASQEALRTALG